jgi:hypothetical protein
MSDQDPQVTKREIKLSAEIIRLRAEVGRLTRERDDAREVHAEEVLRSNQADADLAPFLALVETLKYEHDPHKTTMGVSGRMRNITCSVCQALAHPAVQREIGESK